MTASNPNGESGDSNESAATVSDLVARLKFDETSGDVAADSSGNDWHAEVMNGAIRGIGRIGNAVQLDSGASQYVGLPPAVAEGLTDVTFMTWVRLDTATQWSRVFDFGGATTPSASEGSYMFLTPSSGSEVRFAITTSGHNNEQRISGNVPLPTGVWTHVAVTLSGDSGRLYVNGNQVGVNNSMTLNPASLGGVTRAYLGRSIFPADPYLNGAIDDFRIFSGALGAGEIALFASPLQAPQNVLAVEGPRRIDLSWSPVPNAGSYLVRGATAPGGPYLVLAPDVTGPSFAHTSLEFGARYYYQVAAVNLAGEGPDSVMVAATAGGTLREEWRHHHFGAHEAIGDAADGADPDGDGLNNLLEYALGSDPLSAAPSAAPALSIQEGHLCLDFHMIDDPDLVYEVVSSIDLVEWDVIWSSLDEEPGEGPVSFVDSVPVSSTDRRFLKLGVSTLQQEQ